MSQQRKDVAYKLEHVLKDQMLFKIPQRKIILSPVHRSIGAICFKYQGKQGKGSGILISKNLVLTAAHNIYTKGKGQHTELKFMLAPFGEVQNSKVYAIESFKLSRFYKQKQNQIQYDYALLKLQEKIEIPIQYKNYCELALTCGKCHTNDAISMMELLICGYPLNPQGQIANQNYLLKDLKGKKIELNQYGLQKKVHAKINIQLGEIEYTISTLPGQSGCPIINEGNIVGIHIGSKNDQTVNVGRLITADVIQNLQIWVKELKADSFAINCNSICCHYPLKKTMKEQIQNLLSKGIKLYQTDNYKLAIEILQQCLKMQRQQNGPNSKQNIETINWIGGAYLMQKDYKKVIQYYEQSISIYQHQNSTGNRGYVNTVYYLGFAYKQIKSYDPAACYYEESLKVGQILKLQKRLIKRYAIEYIQCLIANKSKKDYLQLMQQYQLNPQDIGFIP